MNIKNVFGMLQRNTYNMASQIKIPAYNYFEKVYENLTWEITPFCFLELSVEG